MRRDFFFANFELPDADVTVQFLLPAERLDGEHRPELLQDVLRLRPARAEGARLRPEVDEVLVHE